MLDSIVVFPGACLGLRGENAGRGWGRRENFQGMGLAEKRGYDSDEDQELQPRFFLQSHSSFKRLGVSS